VAEVQLGILSGEGDLYPRLKDKNPILEMSVMISLERILTCISRDLEVVRVSCLQKPVCWQNGVNFLIYRVESCEEENKIEENGSTLWRL